MFNIVVGDILKAQADVIVHQVNCQGNMDFGLSNQIKKSYPNVFNRYKKNLRRRFR